MKRWLFGALVLAQGWTCLAEKKSPAVAGPVVLLAQPELVRGEIAAYPRVEAGGEVSAAVAANINASLGRDEQRLLPLARGCAQDAGRNRGGKPDRDAWQRHVEVTMRGPRFLAFLVTDDYDCGGPYPNFGMQMPLVFDLHTGAPVSWEKLLPRGVVTTLDTGSDGAKLGLVKWEELRSRSKRKADGECKDVFDVDGDESLAYSLGLSAATGTLDAQPPTFSHVIHACAETVRLEGTALRRLRVSDEVVQALAAAKALQAKPTR